MRCRVKFAILGALAGALQAVPVDAQDTSKKVLVHPHPPFAPVAVQQGIAARSFTHYDLVRLLGQSQNLTIQRARGGMESSGAPTVIARPGDIVATRVSNALAKERRDTVELPFRYLTLSSTGADTGLLVVRVVRPPLQFNSNTQAFGGPVYVLLRDSIHPARVDTLLAPVRFSVIASSATIAPGDFTIGHVNLPYRELAVTTNTLSGSLPIHLSTSLNPDGTDFWVSVEQRIELEPVESTIRGFGLQTTVVRVTLPVSAGHARWVVRVSGASVEPDTLTLSGGQTGSVVVRSSSVGTDTLRAVAGSFRSAPTAITYSWPFLFLIACFLGGLTGSEIAGVSARRRGKGTSRAAYFLSGVLTGVFVAVAFAIGLNLTGVQIANQGGEAVVFVVAVLGALLGLSGLAKAVPALGRALEGSRPEG